MHRCYAEPARWEDDHVALAPDEEHHLLAVLRAGDGDAVVVTDGMGREARTKLVIGPVEGSDAGATLLIIPGTDVTDEPTLKVTLIQALLKGDHMDLVVEKATELGVSEVYPVITDRVVTRIPEDRQASRRERWERIATSAMKQCGVNRLPEIRNISRLSKALEEMSDFDLFIIGSLSESATPLRRVLESAPPEGRIAVLIGPEGDLTEEELAAVRQCGAIDASFGKRVLRAETAALYVLSALNFALER